jgi:uncharacterized membrane protein (UPF0127 family)
MSIKDGDRFTLRVGKGSRTVFEVEIVISDEAIRRGLSGRPSLPVGHGMLFVFGSVARQGMWMIEMKFPLDIVWLDETLTVVHIVKDCPPCSDASRCPSYSSAYRVKYAIEMTAGQADKYGFSVGKQLFVV